MAFSMAMTYDPDEDSSESENPMRNPEKGWTEAERDIWGAGRFAERNNPQWNLWIDDVRNPRIFDEFNWEERRWIWAQSVDAARYFVKLWGPPKHMALDHDLGKDALGLKTDVLEFLEWLQRNYPNCVPTHQIHTANPEGRKNIAAFMKSWQKSSRKESSDQE